jgi:putative endonuclease
MKKWKWYVYIIECSNNTYYTGLTWKPEIRYEQHLSKFGSKYTAKHGVKRLAYIEEHINLEVARKREIQIKDWSQEKKKKLIAGELKSEW